MMIVTLDTLIQKATNNLLRPHAAWLMMVGFSVYTLLILVGHIVGLPLGYVYLHTVCSNGCSLTPENVHALKSIGLSIAFYVNFYIVIQVLYILICVGVAFLIVFKKPGQWVPLGLSCFLIGLSAYEGADYPALVAAYPILNTPSQFLIDLGMGLLGMYALLTFPNGKFGSRWVLGFYLVGNFVGGLSAFITNPTVAWINNVFSLLSFPLILIILIYRYRRLLNAREQTAIKWIILSFSVFILIILLVFILLPAIAPADSLALLLVNFLGFFGCGINIAGFLMAVLYANAFDIDVFVRRTLVYTSLTAILALVYAGLIFAAQFVFATFNAQVAGSQFVLVGSTLIIAVLFQPLRHRLQQTIDKRFYRSKYDAVKTIAAFSSTLHQEVDLDHLHTHLLIAVQETMHPAFLSLWISPVKQRKERELHHSP